MHLNMFKENYYSQHGEDGILQEILKRLPNNNKGWRHCIEFGADDGITFSNTRYLVEKKKFTGLFIEPSKRFDNLVENTAEFGRRAMCLNQYVGRHNKLDDILKGLRWPNVYQVLSIDVDGMDYWIWADHMLYRPRVVIIEFNSTIPVDVEFVQKSNPSVHQGASIRSIYELGYSKGYYLVAATLGNAIFVDKQYWRKFFLTIPAYQNLSEIWVDRNKITHLWFGYDGSVHLSGWQRAPWHNIFLKPERIQILPKIIRKYPPDLNWIQKILYKIYRRVRYGNN